MFISRLRGHAARTATATRAALAAATAIVLGTLAGTAAAAPVLGGSSYSVYIESETSQITSLFTATFDGGAEWFLRSGRDISVVESETDLGSGRYRIEVVVTGTLDLFPLAGEGGIVGLGVDGNGFDLDGGYFLEDFNYSYISDRGAFTTRNLADDYRSFFLGDWDGTTRGLFVNGGAGGNGFERVHFRFTVGPHPVDAPGSLPLTGLALAMLGALAARRRAEPTQQAAA
jgi:hypothetical protein